LIAFCVLIIDANNKTIWEPVVLFKLKLLFGTDVVIIAVPYWELKIVLVGTLFNNKLNWNTPLTLTK